MRRCKIGVCQMMVTDRKEDNLERARSMITEASQRGCELVVLPEIFNCPYDHRYFRSFAETYPNGPSLEMLRESAVKTGTTIVGGTIPESEGTGLYNTCFVFGPDGTLLGRHRKAHLFDVELETMTFKESLTFSPGNDLQPVESPIGAIAVAICFDIRFPVFVKALTSQGASLLVAPAAFNTTTGPAHWELLLRARAVDNQVYVVAGSPARNEHSSYQAYGHSMIVNPWGEVIARAGEREQLLTAELDPDFVARVRAELPVLEAERSDLVDVTVRKKR